MCFKATIWQVWARSEESIIRVRDGKMKAGWVEERGFTLIELLVVISVISLLMGILVPVMSKVRLEARGIKNMNNQKQIVSALNLFASDNDDRYPGSVAVAADEGGSWNWSDPTRVTTMMIPAWTPHRAMGEHLRTYIPDADTMYCPNAPHKHKYLQQAWDAGDDWDNPDTPMTRDLMGGTYCFYWNYRGYLPERDAVFTGPWGPASGGRRFSKLLVSDYFGYDHWRMEMAYGSCEPFRGAGVTPETSLLSAYWSRVNPAESTPEFKLRAAYTDGHVETYSPSDVVPMKVSVSPDGTKPYPNGMGYGTFFLPRKALY